MSRRLLATAALLALASDIVPAGIAAAGPLDDRAPVATITQSDGPAAPILVRFDEAAGPVTAENLLVEHADGSTISVIRGCRDAAGAPVACSSQLTQLVRLTPETPFPLGDHVTVVVNPAGVTTPIADAAGNAIAFTTGTQAIRSGQHEQGSGATYTWPLVTASGASSGTFRAATTAGMRATFAFLGDRVTWLTRTGPKDGLAEVRVDGETIRRVDLSAAATTLRVRRSYAGFGPGAHTISILVLGRSGARGDGVAVTVDGFSDERGWFGQDAASYDWASGGAHPDARGAIAFSETAGSSLRIPFWGGGIDLRLAVGPSFGIADLTLDGRRRRSFDAYRSSAGVVRHTISGLSAGLHELVVTVSGRRDDRSRGRRIGIDHLDTAAPIGMFRGLGAWIDLFDYTENTTAATIVSMLDTMRAHGVDTVYLETARYNSDSAFDYPSRVRIWLREAHARGMTVVGWYFPAYSEFLDVDVARTVAVGTYRSLDGERFDAVGIDIEYRSKTSGPPEFNAGIVEHFERVRRRLGVTTPISAIAPPPNQMELAASSWAGFPWRDLGRLADVIQPMAYSSYRKGSQCPELPRYCTRLYTRNAVTTIREQTGMPRIPIHVIGGIADRLTRAEITDFVEGAEAADAFGASMYDHVTLMGDEEKYERLEAFTAASP